jgi:peptide/nickel transport system permease protein
MSLPVGVLSAVRRGSLIDAGASTAALIGVSVPAFWLGVLLILAFSVHLPWFPATGAGDPASIGNVLHHLLLPSLAVALQTAATQARVTRSALLDVLGQDYVRTARAKGVKETVVVYRHALRNALIPIVTVGGMDLLSLLGGTIWAEIVFSRPGLGKLLVDAIAARDYPQVQGSLLAYAVVVIAVNMAVDCLYAWLDPRVSYA